MAMSYSKCPTCGAELKWNPETGNMKCEYCGSEFAPEDVKVKENERIQARETEETQSTDESEGQKLVAYKCSFCGADVVTAEDTAATNCVYCHRPLVITSQLVNEFRPEQIVPFETTKKEAEAIFRDYIQKKKLAPSDFGKEVNIKKIMGVYVPYWIYDCTVEESFAGTGKNITRWSDSKYNYKKVDSYMVERDASMDFHNIPADASQKIDDAIMDSIEPFDFDKAKPFHQNYLNGFMAQKWDVPFEDVKTRIRSRAENTMKVNVKGTCKYNELTVQNMEFTYPSESHKYVMMPVWLLYTEYNGEFYPFAMNGQTKKFTGNVPIDPKKIAVQSAIAGGIGLLASFIGTVVINFV